jgi:hypothetical protein
MVVEYMGGLFAPWRRVNRTEFVVALTLLTLPGLVMQVTGMMENASGWLNTLGQLRESVNAAQSGGPVILSNLIGQVTDMAHTPQAVAKTANMPGLINAVCLLLLFPFIRGRLLDIGQSAKVATILTLLLQISVVNDAMAALAGSTQGPLPLGLLFGVITVIGYTVLSLRGSRARRRMVLGPSRHAQLDDDFPPPAL